MKQSSEENRGSCIECAHWRLDKAPLARFGLAKCGVARELWERHRHTGPNFSCNQFLRAHPVAINKRKAVLA